MRAILSLVMLTCIINSGCDFFLDGPKPYDPEKAGAVIVKSYNITGQVVFYGKHFNDTLLNDYYDMALLNDTIYIHINGTLYLFDKETFKKINEVKIVFPFNERLMYFHGDGLAVINDRTAFLLCGISNTPRLSLFLVNLLTGEATLIENYKEIGLEIESILKIGYDRANDFIWLYGHTTYPYSIYVSFYAFNNEEITFNIEKSVSLISSILFYGESPHFPGIFIEGDKWFYSGFYITEGLLPKAKNIGVELYSISDPSKRQFFINAEYLGTKTRPQNCIYDDPYIWIMVERDGQIQMLKLLPNE